jgi:hypothetical protein
MQRDVLLLVTSALRFAALKQDVIEALPLFSSQFHHPNFTMQKGDSLSH